MAVLLLAVLSLAVASAELPSVSLSQLSAAAREGLKTRLAKQSWWVQVGDLVYSPSLAEEGVSNLEREQEEESVDDSIGNYRYALGHLPHELQQYRVGGTPSMHLLHFGDTHPESLFDLERLAEQTVKKHGFCRSFDGTLHNLEREKSYKSEWAESTAQWDSSLTDEQVQALVEKVDANSIMKNLKHLTSYHSRHVSSQEVVKARQWIEDQLVTTFGMQKGLSSLKLERENLERERKKEFIANAAAKMPGHGGAEHVVVGAHYDDLPSAPSRAPGAEDNGSGVAVMLEVARVLSAAWKKSEYPYHAVHFVGFGGEEIGLKGSQAFVRDDAADLERNGGKLRAAVIMDEVGWKAKGNYGVQLETRNAPHNVKLMDELGRAGKKYNPDLKIVSSFNPFGSDHMPFINKGYPAVLLINEDDEAYPNYHQTGDSLDNVDLELMTRIARLEVAAVARMANPKAEKAANGYSMEKSKLLSRRQSSLERDAPHSSKQIDALLHLIEDTTTN